MRILITGGAGYLGSVTAIELALAGHDVICLDIRGKPNDWEFFQPNAPNAGTVEFVQGDVCNIAAVRRLAEPTDAIVHMAFVVGGPACRKKPDKAISLARDGTESVVKASKAKLLVFSSSDVVYGNNAYGLCSENTRCEPASLYGKLKLECEKTLSKSSSLVILRFPSSFGVSPTMRHNLLTHYLVSEMFKRGRIELYESQVTRTLVNVRDAASSIRHVLANSDRALGQTFNVSSGSWTKLEIAQVIAQVFGGEVVVDEDAGSDPEKRNFTLDCSRIQSTGWRPLFGLEQGVQRLRSYMDSTVA